MTSADVDQAQQILNDIYTIPGPVSSLDLAPRQATDYVGTAHGLCQVDISTSIYGRHCHIGPVIGAGGVELKPRRYFHQKYQWYAACYLAECLNA